MSAVAVAPPRVTIPITIINSPDMPSASKITSRPYTWSEVRDIIRYNDLELFARSEESTEKYHQFKRYLKSHNSTVVRHIVTHALQWKTPKELEGVADCDINVKESGDPLFTNASDLKIVRNDFPYHFEDDVVHLCVWTKRRIPSDPESQLGDLSKESRDLIERYVNKTFVQWLGIPREDIVWFRNWEALQSVKEISHVHVIIKGLSKEKLQMVLGSPGVPL